MDEKKGGWSEPVKKGGKKGKKKPVQAEEDTKSSLAEDEEFAEYGKGKKFSIHPKSKLDDETKELLQPIFDITAFLNKNFRGQRDNQEGFYVALVDDVRLTDATIFCFKVIGSCVELAAQRLEEQKQVVPLFWKQLINLRNALIHHLLDENLSEQCLRILGVIVKDWSQIYDYFRVICEQGHTEIDESKGRYKRFHDVMALAIQLRKEVPKSERGKDDVETQEKYLTLIGKILRKVTQFSEGINLTEKGMKQLLLEDPRTYYALQNCLEFLAVLTTPNPEYCVLTEESRKKMLQDNAEIKDWLEDLGDSRNFAIHENFGLILDRQFSKNIIAMLKINLILAPMLEFESKQPGVILGKKGVAPTSAKDSPAKIMKSLGAKASPPKVAIGAQKQPLPQNPPQKSVILPKNPGEPPNVGSNQPKKQSGTAKKAPPKTSIFKK